jgi:hypothetical protein
MTGQLETAAQRAPGDEDALQGLLRGSDTWAVA